MATSSPAVFNSESQLLQSFAWASRREELRLPTSDNLHERFEIKTINHQEAYGLDRARTDMAEEYFSRLRRSEIGIHRHIAGAYLLG